MTEAEYVRAIREAAARYIDVIRDPRGHLRDGCERIRRWEIIREKLSAHTTIRLCNAWLERDRANASQEVHGGPDAAI
jgi:hypothetical protein